MSGIANNFIFGKVAHHFGAIDSTNAEALRRLRQHPPPAPGTLIQADYQSVGRGQAGNSWFAETGKNLLFSVILYPNNLPVADLFRLTQVQSLAIVQAVRAWLAPVGVAAETVRIKWPNDIYVSDKKLAGILIQNGLQGNRVQWSVIGTGLNINQIQYPPALKEKATSLLLCTGSAQHFSIQHCLNELTASMASNFNQYLTPEQYVALDDAYHSCLYRLNESCTYQRTSDQRVFDATLRGVTQRGLLRLEKKDGQEELFNLKSIAFL